MSTRGHVHLCTWHAQTPVAEHLVSAHWFINCDIAQTNAISHVQVHFSCSARLCLVLSCVGSVSSGDPSCSTSSPGGHLVDGLPPAANARSQFMNQHADYKVMLCHKVRWAQVYVRQRRFACGMVLPFHLTVVLTFKL